MRYLVMFLLGAFLDLINKTTRSRVNKRFGAIFSNSFILFTYLTFRFHKARAYLNVFNALK
ncbi:Uncharacterised protein [Myroides odoratus]|nr:hypothetical protein HMPREF9716_02456 [Myroides odoratus CIP 103059]STZ30692.1 Uncharacterised protein [Myroides odoratus]